MDRERFDALARLLATKGSRRGALGTFLSVTFLGLDPIDGQAKPGKRKAKGHDKRRGKGHHKARDGGKGAGHTEPNESADDVADDVADEITGDGAPRDESGQVQAQAQRGGKSKRGGKRKGKGKGKGKNRRGKRDNRALASGCCGNDSCTPPSPGNNNKSDCDFAGQDLSGGSYGGANFGNIDGRGTNFNNSFLGGANFGRACLQDATFIGADLRSTNFGDACLFDADFTDANLELNSPNLSTARFCRTILPTAGGGTTVNNRDCGRGSSCCVACSDEISCPDGQVCCDGRCRAGECCGTDASTCEERQCQTASCSNGQCSYTPVRNGPGPECHTRCCSGDCCPSGVTTCTANEQCPVVACSSRTCPNGCCDAQGVCRTNANNTCGTGGVACVNCSSGQVCTSQGVCCTPESRAETCAGDPQLCGTVTNNCGQPVQCDCPVRTCRTPSCDTSGDPDVCRYTPVFGDSGPNCDNSICCRNANGAPECCPEGTTACTSTGRCAPICNANTCPNGCCDASGVCRTNSDATCGVGGTACRACDTDNCFECDLAGAGIGTCVFICLGETPNCNGNGQCVECVNDGDCDANACESCSTDADVCFVDCPPGSTCNGSGDCVAVDPCTPQSCPDGCCDANNVCRTNSNNTCGIRGVDCVDCPDTQVCTSQGVCCIPESVADTCAGEPPLCGTVINNCGQSVQCDCPVRTCRTPRCATGPDPDECRYDPVFGDPGPNCEDSICCENENGNPVCCPVGTTTCTAGGLCGPACNATNCPNGCCDSSGVCRTSSNATCGVGGVACDACNTAACFVCGTAGDNRGICVFNCSGGTPVCNGSGQCVECLDNGDCDDAACETCNTTTGTCVVDCPAETPICNGSGTCVECLGNEDCNGDACESCNTSTGICFVDCPEGTTCNGSGDCVADDPCTAESCPDGCCDVNNVCQTSSSATCGVGGVDCIPCNTSACFVCGTVGDDLGICISICTTAAPICNPATGTCVECLGNGDCSGAACEICDTTTGTCVVNCPTGTVCNGNGQCVECLDNEDCDAGTCEICQTSTGTCVSTCTPEEPICNPATGTCVECLDNGDCDAEACETCQTSTGTCVGCPPGSTCNTTTGICDPDVECNATSCPNGCCDSNGVCRPNSDQFCGVGGAQCVECDTDACFACLTVGNILGICASICTDALPICNPLGDCVPDVECTSDTDCNAAACLICDEESSQCVSECPAGQTCDGNGTCVPAGDCSPANCPNGCCDPAGICRTLSDDFCGVGGAPCVSCDTDACFACVEVGAILGICLSVCTGGTPICNPAGDCVDEQDCDDDTDCNAAACLVCDTASDTCVSACLPGQECDGNGNCVPDVECNGTTCPNGCCDANGICRTNSDAFCGVGGGECVACNSDACQICATVAPLLGICISACLDPLPICNPDGTCVDEVICTDDDDCNTDACFACVGLPGVAGVCLSLCTGIGGICNGSGVCNPAGECNGTTCPDGCCDPDGFCRTSSDATCGVGGDACVACDTDNCFACATTGANEGTCVFACTGATPNCDGDGRCVECLDNEDCDAEACETCQTSTGTCVGCPPGSTCNTTTDTCDPDVECTAESCPDGCCDANGVCRPNSDQFCGVGGAQCVACDTDACFACLEVGNLLAICASVCTDALPICNPAGLCVAEDECTVDTDCNQAACLECDGGTCVTTCPDGQTCDGNGNCVPAGDCSPANCPDGCCDPAGICRTISDAFCGVGGAPCVSCDTDACFACVEVGAILGICLSVCTSGAPICNPEGECVAEQDCTGDGDCNAAACLVCDTASDTCVSACLPGQSCDGRGNCVPETVCNSSTCPDGCCDSRGICRTNSDAFCGVGGAQCVECDTGACFGCLTVGNLLGICVSLCSDALPICNPEGICVAPSQGTCTSDTQCNAAACFECDEASGRCVTTCNPGTTCDGSGSCVPAPICNGTTCPNGCCDAAGVCRSPSDGFCGVGGAPCVACRADACQVCASVPPLLGICVSLCSGGLPICNPEGDCVAQATCTGDGDCNAAACLVCQGGDCVSTCDPGEICDGQGNCSQVACNSTTCPNGCCDQNGVCQTLSNEFCGVGGRPCAQCSSAACQICAEIPPLLGTCVSLCTPGLPICNPALGQCVEGDECTVDSQCDEAACFGCVSGRCVSECGSGETCNSSGTCIPDPVCNANTCPNGCCDENGDCQTLSNEFCGVGGRPCVRCSSAACQICATVPPLLGICISACSGALPICNPGGECVGQLLCNDDDDCNQDACFACLEVPLLDIGVCASICTGIGGICNGSGLCA